MIGPYVQDVTKQICVRALHRILEEEIVRHQHNSSAKSVGILSFPDASRLFDNREAILDDEL